MDDGLEVSVIRVCPLSLPEDSHHPTLEISFLYNFDVKNKTSSRCKHFSFSKANYSLMNHLFSNTDWSDIMLSSSIDSAVSLFNNKLYSVFESCVPKIRNADSLMMPWFSRNLRRLKNRKSRLFKKFKSSGCSNDYIRYAKSR